MTRIEFIRNTGRWMIFLLMMAAGGFLFASGRISLRDACPADPDCNACGFNRICKRAETIKDRLDEKG